MWVTLVSVQGSSCEQDYGHLYSLLKDYHFSVDTFKAFSQHYHLMSHISLLLHPKLHTLQLAHKNTTLADKVQCSDYIMLFIPEKTSLSSGVKWQGYMMWTSLQHSVKHM